MKKTLIALMALAGVASADSPLTLVDQWTFDGSLTSVNGKTFSLQTYGVSYADGIATITRTGDNAGAVHLSSTGLGLEKNWALQMTVSIPVNSSGTALSMVCFDNGSGNGLEFNLANPTDGGVYGFTYNKGDNTWTGWGAGNQTDIKQVAGMTTLTFVNYEGAIYFGAGDTWATFNNGTADSPTNVANGALDKLLLGSGSGGANGPGGNYSFEVDDIVVYSFDTSKVSVADVKAALIPEPATATLSLLALAGLCARRRRA